MNSEELNKERGFLSITGEEGGENLSMKMMRKIILIL